MSSNPVPANQTKRVQTSLRQQRGQWTSIIPVLVLALGLGGCALNSIGLPGGLPIPPGGGTLTISRSTLVNGITGRTYTIWIPTSGGTGTLAAGGCTIISGALPAGLSIAISDDSTNVPPVTAVRFCKITGTITTVGPATVSFTVQAADTATPANTASQAFSILVRPEFTVTTVTAFKDAVQGEHYGDAAQSTVPQPITPQPVVTNVSATVGNAPLNSTPGVGCVFTISGSSGFITTPLPTGGNTCSLSSGTAAVGAAGNFTATLAATDTDIMDTLAGQTTKIVVPKKTISSAALALKVNPPLAASFNQFGNTNPASTLLDGVNLRSYGVINAGAGAPTWSVTGGLGAGTAGVANYSWCVSAGGASVTAAGLAGISTNCAAPTAGVASVKLTSASAVTGAASFSVAITDTWNGAVISRTATQGTSVINALASLSASFVQGVVAPNANPATTLLDGVNGQSYGVINANAGAPKYTASGGLGAGTAGAVAYQWCVSAGSLGTTNLGGISTNCGAPSTGSPVLLTSAAAATGAASYSVQLTDAANAATPAGGPITLGTSTITVYAAFAASFNQAGNTIPASTLLDGVNLRSYGVITAGAGAPTWSAAGGLGLGVAGANNYKWCVSAGAPTVIATGLSGISTNCLAPTSGANVTLTSASATTGAAIFSVDATDTGNEAVPNVTITQGTSTINVFASLTASFVQGVVTPNTNPATTLLDGVNGQSYGVITANAGAPTYTATGGLGAGTAGAAANRWCVSAGSLGTTNLGGISTNCAAPTTGSPVRLTAAPAVTGSASFDVQLVDDTGNAATPAGGPITLGTSTINILVSLTGSFVQGVVTPNTNPNSTLLDGSAGQSYGVINANAGAPKYSAGGGLGAGTAGAAAYQWCVFVGGYGTTSIAGISMNCAAPTTGTPVMLTAAPATAGTASYSVRLQDTGNEATPASTVMQGTSVINVQTALTASFVQGVGPIPAPNTNPNSTLLDGVNGRSYGVINAGAGAPKWSVTGGLGAGTAGVGNYGWCVSAGSLGTTNLSGISTNCLAPTTGAQVQLTAAPAATGVASFAVDVTDTGNEAVQNQTVTQGTSVINVLAALAGGFDQAGNTNPNSTLLDGSAGLSYGVINTNAGAPTYTASAGLGSGTAGAAAYQWCVSAGSLGTTSLSGVSTNCAAPSTGTPVMLTATPAAAGTASYTVQLTDTGNEATALGTLTFGTSVINVQTALTASFVQGVVTPNTNPNSTLLDGVNGKSYGVINANAGAPKWSVTGGLGAGTAGVGNYGWCISAGGLGTTNLGGISTNCLAPTTGVTSVQLTSASAVTGVASFSVAITDAGNAAVQNQTITQGTSVINVLAALAGGFDQAGNTNPNSTLLDGSAGLSYGVINTNAGAPTYTASAGLGSGTAGATAYQWCVSVGGYGTTSIAGISTNCAAPTTGTPARLTSGSATAGTASYTVQLTDTGNEATALSTLTFGTSVINVQLALTASFVQGVGPIPAPNTNPNSTLLDGVDGRSYGVINAGGGAPKWSVTGGLGAGTAGVGNYGWCISAGGLGTTSLSGISTNCLAPTTGAQVQLTAAPAATGVASFSVAITDAGNAAVQNQTITQGTSVINVLAALAGGFDQAGNTNPNSTLLDGSAGLSYGVINTNAGAPTYTASAGLGSGTAGATAYQWCVSVGGYGTTSIAGISTNCAAPTTGTPVLLTSGSATAGTASYTVQLTDTGNEATALGTLTFGTSVINVQTALTASFVQGVGPIPAPNTNPNSTLLDGVNGRSYGVINAGGGAPKWSVANGLGAGTAGVTNYKWCVSAGSLGTTSLSGISTNCLVPTTGAQVQLTAAPAATGVASFSVAITDAGNAAVQNQTITQGTSVINIQANLSVALNALSPDPTTPAAQAVVGRTYGLPAMTDVEYKASNGLGGYVFAFSGTLTTATNISCTPSLAIAACNSGGSNVTNTGGNTAGLTVDVDDTANEATPDSFTVGATASLTDTYTINAALTITTTQTQVPNALENFTYNPPVPGVNFATSGGLALAGLTWNGPGAATANCALRTGTIPTGLTLGLASGSLTGTPTATSPSAAFYTFEICAEDTANNTTPAGGSGNSTFVIDVMNTLAAAAGPGTDTVEVINTGNGAPPAFFTSIALTAGDIPTGVAVTPDGRKLYVTANGNSVVRVIDTITGLVTGTIGLGACVGPQGIAMALPGGGPTAFAFVGCSNRRIAVINASTDTFVSAANYGTVGADFYGVAVTPNDALVYVTDAANNQFVVLNAATALEIGGSPFPAGVTAPHGVAISADGNRVYLAGSLSDDVVVLATANNITVVAGPISTGLGSGPEALAVTPDALGAHVYVTLTGTDRFAVFDDTLATPALTTAASIDPTINVGAVRALNVVTITTTAAHGFAVGQAVAIAGVTDPSFDGVFVIATVPTATTFTYAQVAADATSEGGTASFIGTLTAASSPWGITIPPLLTVPATGVRVYIAQFSLSDVAIHDDETVTPFGPNAFSPIALTPLSTPTGITHIPVPR